MSVIIAQSTISRYDSRNRLVSKTYADSGTRTYSYDPAGNMTGETDPNANVFVNTFDVLNRMTQTSVNGTVARTFTYDTASRLLSASDTNEGRLFCEFSRIYDKNGRVFSETQTVGTDTFPVNYSYDLSAI
jgi:YD repeat-containing protein